MAETRIEGPRSVEARTGKAVAQSMSAAKSVTAATGEAGQGFSSLLASLDGIGTAGLPQAVLQSTEMSDTRWGPGEQEALLVAQGHAPWMSLVGQTAQLDGQGDTDLRQGVATDFLSGRGHAAQLAHRQALQPESGQAHAAFMGKELSSNQTQAYGEQAQVAINSEGAALQSPQDVGTQAGDGVHSTLASVAEEAPAARIESAVHKAQALPQQGISLQGMTSVQPQALEGLKDLLRAARSPQQDEAAPQGRTAAVPGGPDLQAAAAAVGAAMGAASAGTQGGGQSGSDVGQSLAGQDAAPAEREQEVSEQVAFWVHQKTQNAALSIQHEGKPIQVQVQLNGQQAHVRFAAGDEQARQLLSDGQAQLRELLQAQGLHLSGVSVDAGGADARSSGNSQDDDARRGQARVSRVSVNAAELPSGAAVARHGARPVQPGVDLFV
ncbi:flagellar hook-length control protein FliK [Comamonas testosteroni]|uniref:flagellar hook-length control protein FliK n=1 Tax=Comamonas testosteroni TaxID=285 RepID=UPI002DB7CB0C|nr:flagellar hook-length control protein FliK [Comamonas testosteroni]MEB5966766.1 flagellar hook-length control protein FliK [Comamonas testosteroni]